MSWDIHLQTCNFGTREMRKNRFTGKMQSVSVPDTLASTEQTAILKLFRSAGAPRPDEFGAHNIRLRDGGSADVRPVEDGETQKWVGLVVVLRSLSPGLAQLVWDFCQAGNMAAVPVLKDQTGLVLVASEEQRERALARWSAPAVVDSPDHLFRLLSNRSTSIPVCESPVSTTPETQHEPSERPWQSQRRHFDSNESNPAETKEGASSGFLETRAWPSSRDVQQFDTAFARLNERGILAIHNGPCCSTCVGAYLWSEAVPAATDAGQALVGYVFYNEQDSYSVSRGDDLFLICGPIPEPDDKAECREAASRVATLVQRELESAGLKSELAEDCDDVLRLRLSLQD